MRTHLIMDPVDPTSDLTLAGEILIQLTHLVDLEGFLDEANTPGHFTEEWDGEEWDECFWNEHDYVTRCLQNTLQGAL
jgi:hypothetical protein